MWDCGRHCRPQHHTRWFFTGRRRWFKFRSSRGIVEVAYRGRYNLQRVVPAGGSSNGRVNRGCREVCFAPVNAQPWMVGPVGAPGMVPVQKVVPAGGSSNGRTTDSDSVYLGSSPSPPANFIKKQIARESGLCFFQCYRAFAEFLALLQIVWHWRTPSTKPSLSVGVLNGSLRTPLPSSQEKAVMAMAPALQKLAVCVATSTARGTTENSRSPGLSSPPPRDASKALRRVAGCSEARAVRPLDLRCSDYRPTSKVAVGSRTACPRACYRYSLCQRCAWCLPVRRGV